MIGILTAKAFISLFVFCLSAALIPKVQHGGKVRNRSG